MPEQNDGIPAVTRAEDEEAIFRPGDTVRVATRSPIGHYRVPLDLRGKQARIEAVIEPRGVDNEQEAYGRNAGSKRHYYRVAVALADLWPGYAGQSLDTLRIEVFETWLERA